MTEKRAWIPAPGFVSLVKKPNGGLAFLTIQREGGKAKLKAIETLGNIEVEDEAFIPFLVPHLEAVEEAFHRERGDILFEDTARELKRYVHLPHDSGYIMKVAFIGSTYHIERHDALPFQGSMGEPNAGKSQLLEAMLFMSFSPLIMDDLREGYFIRITDAIGPCTLALDFEDFEEALRRSGALKDKILGRWRRGRVTGRVLNPHAKGLLSALSHYSTFGPLLWASNKPVSSTILVRSHVAAMQQAKNRKFPAVKEENLLPIRERYVGLRARFMSSTWMTEPEKIKLWGSKFGDLAAPLIWAVDLMAPQYRQPLLDELEGVYAEYEAQQSASFEADLAQAIVNVKVKTGKALVSEVTTELKKLRPGDWVSPESIGWTARSMGLPQSKKTTGGYRHIPVSDADLDHLAAAYGASSNGASADDPWATTVDVGVPS